MMPLLLVLACAQSGTLEAEAGFQGGAFPGSWTRITVTMGHEGPPLDAELRITLFRPGHEPVILRRPVRFVSRGRLRMGYDVFLTGMELSADVEVATKEAVLGRTKLTFNFIFRDGPRLLTVGPAPELLTLGMGRNSLLNVVNLAPDRLPASALALQCLDAILIREPVELEAEQQEALQAWILRGGRLIFGAGGRATLLRQNAFWRERCPLELPNVGVVSVPSKEGPVPVTILRGALKKGRATLSVGADPAVVHAREGLGDVVFLCLPFDQGGLGRVVSPAALLSDVMDEPPPAPQPPTTGRRMPRYNPSTYPYSLSDLQVITSQHSFRLGIIVLGLALGACYVTLIGPVDFLRLRKTSALRTGWKSFSVLLVVFTGLIVGWGATFSLYAPTEVHVEFWDADRIQTLSAFRPGKSGIYEGTYAGTLTPQAPLIAYGGRITSELTTVDLTGRVRYAVPPSEVRSSLSARSPKEEDGSLSAVWIGTERRRIDVKNRSSASLKECWLVSTDAVWSLDAIPAGAERRIDLRNAVPFESWSRTLQRVLLDRAPLSHFGSITVRQDSARSGLLLSFYEALNDTTTRNGDHYILRTRGIDLSPALKRGEFFLVGSYDRGLSSIRMAAEIPVETFGWARVRVTEAAP